MNAKELALFSLGAGNYQKLVAEIESAVLAKLTAGVEVLEAVAHGFVNNGRISDALVVGRNDDPEYNVPLCTVEAALQYGASQRLAGQKRETCTWTEQDDPDMPGVYASGCGEMWSFSDGGVKENRVTYCHHCGNKVVLAASPQERT